MEYNNFILLLLNNIAGYRGIPILAKSHDYQPLEVVQDTMKATFRGLMTDIAEQVDCIQREEKKVSLIMDTVEEQCREMRWTIVTQNKQNVCKHLRLS